MTMSKVTDRPTTLSRTAPQHTVRNQSGILMHHVLVTLPRVQRYLSYWRGQAQTCVDPVLRQQALASLEKKAFHCQGGAVFASFYPRHEQTLLQFIVAYQTICDYLDNLCDRAGSTDGRAFRHLHHSLLTGLTPGSRCHDYYLHYPHRDDGGYLAALVAECQRTLSDVPGYQRIQTRLWELAGWYSELQVRKHLDPSVREEELRGWTQKYLGRFPGLRWQEFAAATGSTLAIFALLGQACQEDLTESEAQMIWQSYFPWICGLHILLDYVIDRQEDRDGGDMNFTFYYRDEEEMVERMRFFIYQAKDCAASLPQHAFHRTVIDGLLGLYLSDSKVEQQHYQDIVQNLLQCAGRAAVNTYRLCRLVRRVL